jgi:tryptophanyl-tRNA synthetase
MKKIVSGIQTTGKLHLGNYLGSIRNWLNLQNEYKSYLFLADLHAHTVKRDISEIKEASYELVAAYIACGIDYNKSVIFNQSNVPAHTELAWILGCKTPIGWLNRMTQFKDKAGKDKENASCGLYTYPVLMASDILLYKPDLVPVGEDQKQHVELTRDIAQSFNRFIGQDYFNAPEPLISGPGMRVMSLRDGKKKMSKTDESEMSRINLIDSSEDIAKKIMKAKTDSIDAIFFDKTNRPEVSNLISIYAAIAGENIEKVESIYQNSTFTIFKQNLTSLLIEHLNPITSELNKLLGDKKHIEELLKIGVEKANLEANKTIQEVKTLLGFVQA